MKVYRQGDKPAPPPFNCYKHVGGTVRTRMNESSQRGEFVVVINRNWSIVNVFPVRPSIMALRLHYSTGDPDYLKVVLLTETLRIPHSAFIKSDGEHYLEWRNWAMNFLAPHGMSEPSQHNIAAGSTYFLDNNVTRRMYIVASL